MMDKIYSLVEILATITENTVLISAVLAISGQRLAPKNHVSFVLLSAVLLSAFVVWMNSIVAFSFFTPVCSIAIISIIISKPLSNGKFLLRLAGCVIAIFVVQTIDYVLVIGMGFMYENFDIAFKIFVLPGPMRSFYLFINKGVNVLLFFALRKYLPSLNRLSTKMISTLLVASLVLYITMQYLFSAVLFGDFYSLHTASIIFFFILLCFMVAIIFMLFAIASSENSKTANKLLVHTNLMMEQNYMQISDDIKSNAKRLHDFNHHLSAIRGLAVPYSANQIILYVDSLLSTSYKEIEMCHSGSDIIDAVINCKTMEALDRKIDFSYNILLEEALTLDPVDICAVLANQIENAFEACEKIPAEKPRVVTVKINQKRGFVVFKVENSVLEDPFINNKFLHTTKTDTTYPHGLGLKNIRDISNKHNGLFHCTFTDEKFVSTAFLSTKNNNHS